MLIKIVLSLVCIGLLLVPLSAFAQRLTCSEVLDHCISKAENQYNECSENCNDQEVLEATDIPACIAKGYKPSSLKYQECIEEYIKSCKRICKEDYHENTGFCQSLIKNVERGNVV